MIKLNKHSYCHVKIRELCYRLERITGMRLETNLSEEFDQLRFKKELGYITIDYKNNTVFVLGHKLGIVEKEIIDELRVNCNWLELGNKYSQMK